MRRAPATAKLNLALVVGPVRDAGKHELTTVYQRIDLADRIAISPGNALSVEGFAEDTIVRRSLESLAGAAGVEPKWRVRITKRIPVAAGLGGGSSDAATALRLANETLDRPLTAARLRKLATALGADVPFFLTSGPQVGTGDGTRLTAIDLPQDYWVVLLFPKGAEKSSTRDVYEAFDARDGSRGYRTRRAELRRTLEQVGSARDLAALPPNDLATSPLADELTAAGAFRADVSGGGPVVYGLFLDRGEAQAAAHSLRPLGRTWLTVPTWYG